jgi:hypothetical protein
MTTAIPYNLKPKDTKLPAGQDKTLDPPAPLVNPLLAAFRQNAWPKADTSRGSTFPPDAPPAPGTDAMVRGLAPFKWPKGVLPAIPNRPQREATIPVGALDPDIALWQNVIVSIWPFTGPPIVGSWPKGWLGIDNTPTLYVCTVAGDPGTWEPVGGQTITGPLTITMPVGSGNGLVVNYVTGATGQAIEVNDDIEDPITATGPTGGNKVFGDHLGVVFPGADFTGDELSFNGQTNPPSQTLAGTGTNGVLGINTLWFTQGVPSAATILNDGDVGIRTNDPAYDVVHHTWYYCTAGGTPSSATWAQTGAPLTPFAGVLASPYAVTTSQATWDTITLPTVGNWRITVNVNATAAAGGLLQLFAVNGTAVGTIFGPNGALSHPGAAGGNNLSFEFIYGCTTPGTLLLQAVAASASDWSLLSSGTPSGFVAGNS